MSYKQIPVTATRELYQITVALNGIKYNLRYRYNSRNDTWYKDILTLTNQTILSGIPTLCNVINMTRNYRVMPDQMLGDFLYIDITGNDKDASLETFGSEILLYYIDIVPPLALEQSA